MSQQKAPPNSGVGQRVVSIERLMLIDEVADVGRMSRRTVQREVSRGRLRAIRIGRQIRFHPRDVEAWLAGEGNE